MAEEKKEKIKITLKISHHDEEKLPLFERKYRSIVEGMAKFFKERGFENVETEVKTKVMSPLIDPDTGKEMVLPPLKYPVLDVTIEHHPSGAKVGYVGIPEDYTRFTANLWRLLYAALNEIKKRK